MKKVKDILTYLKPFVQTKVIRLLFVKLGASVTGPLGLLASFLFDLLWDKSTKHLFKKIKQSKRSKAKKEIENAENAEELKAAVDEFLD